MHESATLVYEEITLLQHLEDLYFKVGNLGKKKGELLPKFSLVLIFMSLLSIDHKALVENPTV